MWGRGYWGAAYFGEPYWPTGTAGAVIPPAPAASGGGGAKPRRRRFELDLPQRQREKLEPKREPRRKRVPAVHVGLSLRVPLPVLLVEAQVQPLDPVAVALRLPALALPPITIRARVLNPLGLAHERIDELEAVLAAVMEDE